MHFPSRSVSLLLAVCVCLSLSSCGMTGTACAEHSGETGIFYGFQGSDGSVNKDSQFSAVYDGDAITVSWNGTSEYIYRLNRTDELTGNTESIVLVYPGDAFRAEDIPPSADFHYT